jgi:uroporphyrin-III C-methyltransferase
MIAMVEDLIAPGEVWLVGAGPGDPDLLTRKAEKLIQAADIIFHDALVGAGILDLIPVAVERVGVGKRAGRHSRTQATINDLIVAAALKGRRVVRLKGGDPSIFGRSMEEMAALTEFGVRARICPGITAASAAAASAGLSLTLRGLARKLVFVTAHAREGEALSLDWKALADPGATLAVYMGKSSAGMIAKQLIGAGLVPSTPVLAIENASLAGERIVRTRLDLLEIAARTLGSGPALLLIGDAVGAASPVSIRVRDTIPCQTGAR